MPRFEIQMNGRNFEIEAPDFNAAAQALQGFGAKPQEQAIPQGDWNALKGRLDKTEQDVMNSGPYRPQDIKAAQEGEARRQGELYGQQYGKDEVGAGVALGSFANTVGLGLPRYLEAATNPVLPTAQAHEFLKGSDEGRGKARPVLTTAGQIGGYVTQAAMLPASGATSLAARLASAGAQSGALGAAESAIESRGDIGQTLQGGAFGMAAGAAGAGLGEGLIAGGRRIFNPLNGLGRSGPADQQAAARILRVAQASGIDDATAQRKLAELGPEGFLADILGARGQALARTAANTAPDAREILENASTGRIAGQQGRLISALEDAASGNPLGTKVQGPTGPLTANTIEEAQQAVYQNAKPAVSAAYDAAMASGVTKPIQQPGWFEAPLMQEALNFAKANRKNRVAAFGEAEGSQFGLLDDARQYLARKAYEGTGSPEAKALAAKLNQFIDDSIPEASGARGLAQGYKQQQAALETGADLARTRPNPNSVAEAGKSQYPGQTAQGYGIAKINEINQRAPGKRTVDIIDGTPAQREALMAALGSRAAGVQKQAANERQFLAFNNALSGNSTTARQLAEMGALGGAIGGGGYMAGFDPAASLSVGALLPAAKVGGKKIMEALARKNELAVSPEVARRLIERELPKLVDASGKKITETARRRLVEALMSSGARAGALGYSQN